VSYWYNGYSVDTQVESLGQETAGLIHLSGTNKEGQLVELP